MSGADCGFHAINNNNNANNNNNDQAKAKKATVVVNIQWCGGWGYGSRFRAARDLIVNKYGDAVEVVSAKDPKVTGNFEVTVNGELVHSKKTKDHGFLHTNEDQQKVVYAAIGMYT